MGQAMERMDGPGMPVDGWAQDDEGYWKALLQQGEVASNRPHQAAPVEAQSPAPVPEGARSERVAPGAEEADWPWVRQALENGEPLCLPVVGHNRGGLLVRCRGLEGFVPASHLTDLPRDLSQDERMEQLAQREGLEMTFYVIEVDEERQRLVLSQRGPASSGQANDVLARLRAGMTCKGQVTNVCDFGAFVDLGGVEGLVHISEISWGRVHHPADFLEAGQEVEVLILSVDARQQRVALSMKRLEDDPWATVEERYHVGQLVEGVVTNVVDFGAFVRVEDGLEGLVHISELADGDLGDPRQVVREGEPITVSIVNIDGPQRRLGLSLRRAAGGPSPASDPGEEG